MTTTDRRTDDDRRPPTLDVSDLDQYMGVPMEPGELKEPVATQRHPALGAGACTTRTRCTTTSAGPAESRFGAIVAPQSFTVATDTSHGCSPAQVGKIPNSHLIFGGDDWWFFGPRIEPGDHLVCHRMPYDYKVTDTKFAGPTCFQRGDTLYINQRGERVALQRSTAIRYQVREAKEKKLFSEPQRAGVDRRAARRARGAASSRSSTRSRRCATTSGSFDSREGRRPAGRATSSARTAWPASPPSGAPTR